jgi:mRNA interferase MazF
MYKQRDILLIPVPFTDLATTKLRPVIVLSNDDYNCTNPDIVVAAITSNLTERDFSVRIESSELESGALPKPSLIRADKIYTLSNDIVRRKYATLKSRVFSQVIEKINQLMQ